MFKDFIQSIYEKVYIINFEKCSQIPCLTSEELKSLGKKSWKMVCLDW
ncbi:DUF3884 family protein [Streptococcus pneumoniae]|nr:DUF3884 family protein [Streptococcus pneumoniae]HEU7189224.1 DUF3884 family protein [Streptococcus pneumoniae]HEU7199070.1 DUF3884 family protein [Streptococcus pneumoniae]HEU7203112.1 DUF3884 family protein [Streptococcus pneumoniae]HEW3058278.1 DUF3884 family protein [Streptococcus pneumoniae]